ncbi:MAG TPA: chorismate-binding protein [Thermoanaerobaculia bacterium]|nr:chorismate-binding protein [Thermoanaerobaculia bacterium]
MTTRAEERRDFLARASAGRVVPVARVFPSDTLTPVLLFGRMRAAGAECFLLESVEGGESVARYTFLGCGPVARLTIAGSSVEEERAGVRRRIEDGALDALDRLAARPGFVADPALPPLSAGAVGYLAYDAARLFEEIPDRHPRDGAMPDGLFLVFDAVVAFDHPRQRLLLLTNVEVSREGEQVRAVDAAIARLDRLEEFLGFLPCHPERSEGSAPFRERAGSSASGLRMTSGEAFAPLMPRERFLEAVAAGKEAILAGEVYQVVLSQRWTARLDVDPFDAYRALRMLNPSPYMFYLETREGTVFGASPEMLVRCRGRQVETRPIAGTARRGATPEEDAALADAMLADPKERAEHVMLVDLSRNDLGRVCEIGSVAVSRYAAVEKYSHVQHLVSDVRGTLAAGRRAVDALAACFPAGTLTGAPKIRAMELIDELETARRGVYGGVVGYVDAAGNLDVAIAIRTAVVENGICRIQAGAGIVADSVPEKEYREAESKAAALFRAIEMARGWTGSGLDNSQFTIRNSQFSK